MSFVSYGDFEEEIGGTTGLRLSRNGGGKTDKGGFSKWKVRRGVLAGFINGKSHDGRDST